MKLVDSIDIMYFRTHTFVHKYVYVDGGGGGGTGK